MIRVAEIQRLVANTYGVSVDDLKRPDGLGTRLPDKVRPRHLSMYLARTHCPCLTYGENRPISLTHIGRLFGNRDHTTVRHAILSIAKERLENKKLDIVLNGLEREIRAIDEARQQSVQEAGQ